MDNLHLTIQATERLFLALEQYPEDKKWIEKMNVTMSEQDAIIAKLIDGCIENLDVKILDDHLFLLRNPRD